MPITLPEKAVQVVLTNKFDVFDQSSAVYLQEIFHPALYGQKNLLDWIAYYDANKVRVKLGWPNEDTVSPAVYVAAADSAHDENIIGFGQRYGLSADAIVTEDAYVYSKSARVIAASDNYNVSLTLAAICQYFVHQETIWFERFGMSLPRINFQEIEFASQLWPQKFFYRSFLISFMVLDTVAFAKDDTIKGINVELTS